MTKHNALETRIAPTYISQQKMLNEIAQELGVVVFRPNYHGRDRDCNTVLFYTQEDNEYNCALDAQGREQGFDVSHEQYKRPFWWFENTDVNGHLTYEFANRGRINMRMAVCREELKDSIMLALERYRAK